NVPPPPPGIVYVEIAAGVTHTVARRSDGAVVGWGAQGLAYQGQFPAPALPPGRTYVEIASAANAVVARVGATSTYTTFGNGCAGSRPASSLIPRDTPHIGAPLQITITDLPIDAALLCAGLSTVTSALGPLPLDLGAFGMPGCALHVSVDALAFVA